MLQSGTRPPLHKLSEFRGGKIPKPVEAHGESLKTVLSWACRYLRQPHPDLGRKGAVCPFVARAMEMELFFLAVPPLPSDPKPEAVRQVVMNYRDLFMEINPRTGFDAQFKTILMLFPDIPKSRIRTLIDDVQAELSFQFTPLGLMIGEFHAGPPQKPGLWNEEFRPLFCPVPMLVIRHMVDTDLLFLKRDRDLLSDYLDRFGTRIPNHMLDMAKQAIAEHDLDYTAIATKRPMTPDGEHAAFV